MHAYSAADLARAFRTVRKNTIQIAMDIPEAQWSFRASSDTRSVAELLAHIAALTLLSSKLHIVDRKTFVPMEDFMAYLGETAAFEGSLTTREAILRALQTEGEQFAARLEAMSAEELATRVGFPPPAEPASKSRLEMLMGVKEHEMHHRAQLMVLQRMIGVVPHLTRARQQMAAAGAAPAPR
jgi:uncharacterized damage-inducible protein DinB